MLTADENERLTRTGPDTPMGRLFRRYWIPALLSEELVEADGKPVRVRLLGEDLVAFRTADGPVGLIGEACPHRRTSLALALNAEGGLRCIYHGYKFGIDGTCVDTPTEPEGSKFAAKIRADGVPGARSRRRDLGVSRPGRSATAVPGLRWLALPAANQHAYKVYEECNYAQAVEGAIDSAHAGVLHRRTAWGEEADELLFEDLNPKLEVEYTQYGMRYGALRNVAEGETAQARITAVALPCWTFIPPFGGGPGVERRLVNAFVPRDDTSTWHFQFFFNRNAPFDDAHRRVEGGLQLDGEYKKARNLAERLSPRPRSDEVSAVFRDHRHSGPGSCRQREPRSDRRPHARAPRHFGPRADRVASPDAPHRRATWPKKARPRPACMPKSRSA